MRIHTKTVWEYNAETDSYELVEDEFYEYEGPVALASGGGGETTTNTVAQPPAWQVPYMQDVLRRAGDLAGSPGPQYFPGSTVAPRSNATQLAENMTLENATGGAQRTAKMAEAGLGQLMRSSNPLSNPWFSSTANAMIRPATQQLTEQVLPQIGDSFIGAGQFGGSRQGVAEGMAIDRYQQNVLDSLTRYGSNAYSAGLDTLGRSLALAPTVQQMGSVPAQLVGAVGAGEDAYMQRILDAATHRWDYNQRLPYENLNWYSGIVGNPLGTTSSTTTPGASGSRVMNAIGGGLTGAAIGSAIPGLGGGAAGATGLAALGPAGIALGLAGLAMGAFG